MAKIKKGDKVILDPGHIWYNEPSTIREFADRTAVLTVEKIVGGNAKIEGVNQAWMIDRFLPAPVDPRDEQIDRQEVTIAERDAEIERLADLVLGMKDCAPKLSGCETRERTYLRQISERDAEIERLTATVAATTQGYDAGVLVGMRQAATMTVEAGYPSIGYNILNTAVERALGPGLSPNEAATRRVVQEHGKSNKIAAIKALRAVAGLPLKEAKELVDAEWERLGWRLTTSH